MTKGRRRCREVSGDSPSPCAPPPAQLAAVLRDPGVRARLLSAGAGSARGSPGGGEPWLYDAVLSALHRRRGGVRWERGRGALASSHVLLLLLPAPAAPSSART